MNTDETASIDDRPIPDPLAEHFGVALGLAAPPTTLGEWAHETIRLLDDVSLDVGLDAMCTAEETRHEVHVGDETKHLHCVFDTLQVPFLLEEQTTVRVQSKSPVSGTVIEISASRDDIAVDPQGAMMSFGVAADVGPPEDLEIDPALAYERFCPYVNAFVGEAEYDEWATSTPEAVTMPLSLTEGYALARLITREQHVVQSED